MGEHVLAHRGGLALFFAVLAAQGSTCTTCGYGTRRTSKRWARCKREGCDTRVRRRTEDEVDALFDRLREARSVEDIIEEDRPIAAVYASVMKATGR